MVNLITGPRGSGKTQQMIDLANEKVKTSNGNVVFIKKSQQRYLHGRFQYPCNHAWLIILTFLRLEEFVGFLYGMAAGNHDIESSFY